MVELIMNKEEVYREIEKKLEQELSEGDKGHKIISGIGRIMLTAPHSVNQTRHGKIKIGEYRTGLIVQVMRDNKGYPIGYKTKNLEDDANYDGECEFKKELIKQIKDDDIKVIIDLHIASPKREFDIDIGTGHGKNIAGRKDLLIILKEGLLKEYKNTKIDDTFPAAYENTVSAKVCREVGIPSFQLEINWNLLDDYGKMEKFVEELYKIIKRIEEAI